MKSLVYQNGLSKVKVAIAPSRKPLDGKESDCQIRADSRTSAWIKGWSS